MYSFVIPVVALLRAVFSSMRFYLAFVVPSIFLIVLISLRSTLLFEVEKADVRDLCVGYFVLTTMMIILTVVSEYTEKRLRFK